MRAVCDKVRLIAKVGGDYCWITTGVFKAGVSVDQSFPVVNPRRFGIRTRIPKTVGFGAVTSFRTVIIQNRMVIPRPETMDDLVLSFETIPIDSCNANHPAARIDDLIAAGVPISSALSKSPARYGKNDDWKKKKDAGPTLAERRTDTHLDTPVSQEPDFLSLRINCAKSALLRPSFF